MNKDLALKKMNKLNEYYLDKHGTDGYDKFKEFMSENGVPTNTIEFVVKRNWRLYKEKRYC